MRHQQEEMGQVIQLASTLGTHRFKLLAQKEKHKSPLIRHAQKNHMAIYSLTHTMHTCPKPFIHFSFSFFSSHPYMQTHTQTPTFTHTCIHNKNAQNLPQTAQGKHCMDHHWLYNNAQLLDLSIHSINEPLVSLKQTNTQ